MKNYTHCREQVKQLFLLQVERLLETPRYQQILTDALHMTDFHLD